MDFRRSAYFQARAMESWNRGFCDVSSSLESLQERFGTDRGYG